MRKINFFLMLTSIFFSLVIFSCEEEEPEKVKPVLTTIELTEITQFTANSGGNISSDGGLSITARGVCWSTSENPTIDDSFTTDGTGSGSYTSNITGLLDSTIYYVRAYATNEKGTSYGNEVTFTTFSALPKLITVELTEIMQFTANSGGNISSDGGLSITARGVCWSTSENPTIDDNFTSDGAGSGSYTSNITGLLDSTIYYVRAYATNEKGTSYGNEVTFTTFSALPKLTTVGLTEIMQFTANSGGNISSDGGLSITASGVCWSTSENPTIDDNFTTDGTGSGSYISNITGLSENTTYYVRAYATNSLYTGYGNQLNFTTLTLPEVSTLIISGMTYRSVTLGGNIISDGHTPIISSGLCWNTEPNPTINDNVTNDGTEIGSFVRTLNELDANITYYVRAYATNKIGTAYGSEIEFTLWLNSPGTDISDVDGNIYHSVKIGNQVWFSENLKSTHYNNGNIIQLITDNYEWSELNSGAYCYPNGDINNIDPYGLLYNWYATVDNANLCPTGWHVSSDEEWTILIAYLNGNNLAGGALKETGTDYWWSPNEGATNISGFSGLPAGKRNYDGVYYSLGAYGSFWTSTSESETNGRDWFLYKGDATVTRYYDYKKDGFSVRCVKD